jgi:phospholipase/carboxylesterase
VKGYGLDAERLAFVGYSNGANLLGAVILLHPGVVRRAVLMRSRRVVEHAPTADLTGTDVLMLDGRSDPFAEGAPALRDALLAGGAAVSSRDLDAGHELTAADVAEAAAWLASPGSSTAP